MPSVASAATLTVPLDGYAMQLRPSELAAVAAGLASPGRSLDGRLAALADAVRRLMVAERAPTWELAVRHLGHGKPLAQAADEIGLDLGHAEELIDRLGRALGEATQAADAF